MRGISYLAIEKRFSRFCVLLVALAAILSPGSARADAFPDTIYFDGFEACGLQCARVQCPGNGTTSLSGTIYAPEGTIPLPNVEVYIANGTVGAFADGPPALRCDQAPSGHPLVATLTGSDGKFKLVNVPVGTPMNLVVLAGKWRRQVAVPALSACVDTPLDPAATRLPRNHTEGDVAHIALTTGGGEALECLLRRSGVADTEFTTIAGSGRIHLFAGGSGTNHFAASLGGATFADATVLWGTYSGLAAYDQVAFACEGSQNPSSKPTTAIQALKSYADAGGRVYLSHWQNYWLQSTETTWNAIAGWGNLSTNGDTLTASVNTTFPQGLIMSTWLTTVGASAISGKLSITNSKQTALSVDESVARKWLYLDSVPATLQPSVQYFSFTTPVSEGPGAQEGRLLFTDMHASMSDTSSPAIAFPDGCTAVPPNAQDKALLYAFFDLQRCVGSTKE